MNEIKFSHIAEFMGGIWILKVVFTIFNILLRINTKIKMIFLFTTFITIFICIYFLNNNNYYFDKNFEKYIVEITQQKNRLMQRPILQEIYKDGVVNIEKAAPCPFEPTQIHLDVVSVLHKLSKKYSNLKIITYNYAEYPTTPFRLTGDYLADQIFNNEKQIQCDTAIRFKSLKIRRWQEVYLMQLNKSFQNHSIYRNTDCLNCDIFFTNVAKFYKNKLFGHHVSYENGKLTNLLTGNSIDLPFFAEGKVWVFKYNNFYYIINENNGNQGHYQKLQKGKTLIFKKLHYKDFINYDNGTVYKLLKFLTQNLL